MNRTIKYTRLNQATIKIIIIQSPPILFGDWTISLYYHFNYLNIYKLLVVKLFKKAVLLCNITKKK